MKAVNKKQAFQMLIESKVKDGISTYMDVITDYMVENELEAKQVSKLISPTLQEKIKEEAIRNNLIDDNDKGSKLPL
jgi:hypothetical protein